MTKIKKNLKNIDSDKDGLSDYDEINIYHTDPNNPDTDGDGINDCDEIKKGLNPLVWDYFIPNKCNNYRPKALRPKRLFFYGMSALVMKVIVIVSMSSLPLLAFFNTDYITQESKKIIAFTNNIRTQLNIPMLSENAQLNQSATWKAQDMAVKQYFAHISPDKIKLSDWFSKAKYNYKFGGENLAMGFSTAEDVISAWQKSPSHYKNIIDPDFKEIGVGIAVGNYNGYETTFVAQHFGTSVTSNKTHDIEANTSTTSETNLSTTTVSEDVTQKEGIASSSVNIDTNVLSEKETISNKQVVEKKIVAQIAPQTISKQETQETTSTSELIQDATPPILYKEQTKISINQNSEKEYVIMAEVFLSEDTKSADLFTKNYKIHLVKDENNANKWTGHIIINDDNITKPVLSISLVAIDNSGNQLITDIDWQNIIPIKSSVFDHYNFIKSQKNSPVNVLLDFSMTYYKIILVLAIVLLLINIFVEIKQQRIDIIASSVFLILFMILLILF